MSVTVYVPGATAAVVMMFIVAVPVTPLIVFDEKETVKPAGNVPGASVTGELKLFCPTMLAVVLNIAPAVMASEVTSVLRVKPGTPKTVSKMFTVWVMVPPVAVTLIRCWPGVTVLGAVMLSVLVPDPGAAREGALKAEVTPVGNPLTENDTGALKLPVKLPIVSKTVPAD